MLNRIKDRIRARFSVSLCELGDAERLQLATLGVATVSRDCATCHQVLAATRRVVEMDSDALLTEANGEVLALGTSGQGLRGGVEAFGSSGVVDADGPDLTSPFERMSPSGLDGIDEPGDSTELSPPPGPAPTLPRLPKRMRKR